MELEYRVVDVFTQTPLEGNALACFPDARGLDNARMQRIARELNLSETSFVFPPTRDGCVANVRIFTPAYEMRFAGHPTVGTAYVLRATGAVPESTREFAFEEAIGAVPIRVDDGDDPLIWLRTPPIEVGRTYDRAAAATALGLRADDLLPNVPCELRSAGNPNVYVAVRDQAAVDRAWADLGPLRALTGDGEPVCVFVFTPTPQGAYSRMFAPELGVVEDPATGSATGPLASFMMAHGLAPAAGGTRLVSEQGTKMGRRSFLHILVHGENGRDGIEVGGHVRPVATARMTLS